MNNREVSLIWMSEALARLYDSWPVASTVYLNEIIEATGVDAPADVDALALFNDLGKWLNDEQILRIGARALHDSRWQLTVLTKRGFELLSKPVPGSETSTAERLRALTKSAGAEAVKRGAGEIGKDAADQLGSFFGSVLRGYIG